jgi:3-oxoacyl-[acyl-carrier-protein] synthase II
VRAVAVTAVGVVCALGASPEAFADALRAHRSGASLVDGVRRPGAPLEGGAGFGPREALWACAVAPPVADLDGYPDDRKVALLARALEAVLDGVDAPPERRALMLGTGLSSVTPRELEEDVYPHLRDGSLSREGMVRDLATDRVAPRRHLPARGTAWAARRAGVRGPTGTTFSACAAGAEAIACAARAVARGDADIAFAGGHDAMIHPLGVLSFEVLGALTRSVGRPFDKHRDGFMLGEGAAVLRLEAADRLTRPPLAWILGAGSSLDAWGITAPHPDGDGAYRSMVRALRDADVDPADVGWVNAHATATPLGDAAEAAAIRRLMGDRVRVSSLKGAVGHTLAAAGAVEAAATVLAMAGDFIPGTVGTEEPDDLGVDVLIRPVDHAPRVALSNSFGFGGQNATLVFGRAEEGGWFGSRR